VARLIFDTTVLIAAERSGRSIAEQLGRDDDVAIAAITATELLVGVQLADDQHRQARVDFVEEVLEVLPIEDYDLQVARSHAALLAWTRRAGRQRGAFDLIIAATAIASARTVATFDSSGFEGLPGVTVRIV
jgi:tRNA(fMet)-specific endonuclease VapC